MPVYVEKQDHIDANIYESRSNFDENFIPLGSLQLHMEMVYELKERE